MCSLVMAGWTCVGMLLEKMLFINKATVNLSFLESELRKAEPAPTDWRIYKPG